MILPLTNSPSESFSKNINGIVYNFKQRWNTLGFWTLDVGVGTVVIYAVKIVTRENILQAHTSIPFDLRSERLNDPTRDNLNEFDLIITEKSNG